MPSVAPQIESLRKVAWFAPFAPGLRSARLSEALVTALEESPAAPAVVRYCDERREGCAHYFRAFLEERKGALDFGVHVVENREECSFAEQSLRISPGVGIYLDTNLTNVTLRRFRQSTGAADINTLYESEFGERSLPLGDYHVRSWPTEIFERFLPLGRSLLEASALAFFTGCALERTAKKLSPGLRTAILPLPLRSVAADQIAAERRLVRASLELPDGVFVFGVAGGYPADAGVSRALEALGEAKRQRPELRFSVLWLLETGGDEDAARTFAARFLPEADIRISAPASAQEASFFHSACDWMMLLQPDARRGFPASFVSSAERGVPAIVSSVGFAEDVPPPAALRVRPDGGELSVIRALIVELVENAALREACRSELRAYTATQTAARTRDTFLNLVGEHLPDIRRVVKAHREELLRTRRTFLALSQTGLSRELSAAAAEGRREVLDSLGWNIFEGHSDAI